MKINKSIAWNIIISWFLFNLSFFIVKCPINVINIYHWIKYIKKEGYYVEKWLFVCKINTFYIDIPI